MEKDNRKWLVYYSILNGTMTETRALNAVIEVHPADFLIELLEEFPIHHPKLISAIQLSAKQFKKLDELL